MQRQSSTARQDLRSGATGAQPAGAPRRWAADHRRVIAIVWCGVVLSLGALAPFADRALSGAGWEALDSESVAARSALEARFPGRGSYALSVVVAGRRVDDPGHAGHRSRASWRSSAATTRSCAGVPVRSVSRGPQHGGRPRPGRRAAGRDGRGRRPAQGPPRAAVDRPASPSASPGPPRCGRTSTTRTRRRCSSPSCSPGR